MTHSVISRALVVSAPDTVQSELERFLAKRMGATTYESRKQPRPHALPP
jgi:hypothetical protein